MFVNPSGYAQPSAIAEARGQAGGRTAVPVTTGFAAARGVIVSPSHKGSSLENAERNAGPAVWYTLPLAEVNAPKQLLNLPLHLVAVLLAAHMRIVTLPALDAGTADSYRAVHIAVAAMSHGFPDSEVALTPDVARLMSSYRKNQCPEHRSHATTWP